MYLVLDLCDANIFALTAYLLNCVPSEAGTHRSPDQGQYEKTREAREHNRIFAQMVYIMRWAKRLNPHLIVVIENPVGLLQKMPLMKDFIKSFGLHTTTVHYCAFGRDDKKPTHLWTNVRVM